MEQDVFWSPTKTVSCEEGSRVAELAKEVLLDSSESIEGEVVELK